MKNAIALSLILLLITSVSVQSQSPSPVQQQTTPLEQLLNPDGTLNIKSGFSGAVDPKGYRMVENPDGTPRFIPTPAVTTSSPDDVNWDDRFVYPGLQRITGQPDWGYSEAFAVSGADFYVAGEFSYVNGISANCIARWNGTTWNSVADGPNFIYAIAIIGSVIYVGGGFSSTLPNAVADFIQKWDGGAWSALGLGVNGPVYDLAVIGSDLYVGGDFTLAGGASASRVAKWNGTTWSSLGSGVSTAAPPSYAAVNVLKVNGTDLYVGGSFSSAGGVSANNIAMWNGATWSSIGSGVRSPSSPFFGLVNAIAIYGSNIYVGGSFDSAGAIIAKNIAKWNGATWDSIENSLVGPVGAVVMNGSDLYVSGSITFAGGKIVNGIGKWDGTKWDSLGLGLTYSVYPGWAYQMALIGSDLYVGGYFRRAGKVKTCGIAKWDGSAWSPIGIDERKSEGVKGFVRAIQRNGDDVYVGGDFFYTGDLQTNRIAKWNGSAWEKLGNGTSNYPYYGSTFAIGISGSDLYVGGDLDNGGDFYPNIARWDGTRWDSLGSGTNSDVYAIKVVGTDVYVGGLFTSAGGVPGTNYIAKWDGSNWSALGTGMDNIVYAIDTLGGYLYAGGLFTHAGGNPAAHIAKWDGANWTPVGVGLNDFVRCMATSATDLYIGGGFTAAGGTGSNHVVKWDGTTWSGLGTGTTSWVRSISISGNDLYVGGDFTMAGDSSANFIAKWDGSHWSALGNGVNQRVRAVAATNSHVYVGGEFGTAGGKPSLYFGDWKREVVSLTSPVSDGWNMISVPVFLDGDYLRSSVYPTSSSAFAYRGSYQVCDSLRNGEGFWVKFGTPESVQYHGTSIRNDSFDVRPNWNMIGSISSPVAVSSISSVPGGIVTSGFFGYNGAYSISESILPGRAYWVKVSQSGRLILSDSPQASPTTRIRIVSTDELPPLPPDITGNQSGNLPKEFALAQNYPNPFNPLTVIRYELPYTSIVKLKIFNVLGQEVMTLVDGIRDAGYETGIVDASTMASGIYFYRLDAACVADPSKSFTEVMKMILMK